MRAFYLLLLLTFLAQSCATDRIRYVRVKGQPKEFVKVEKNEDNGIAEADDQVAYTSNKIDGVEVNSEDVAPTDQTEVKSKLFIENSTSKDPSKDFSLEEDEPTADKIRAALFAENQAFRSRRNMRLSVIFLGLTIVPIIGMILFFIPALILFIIGWTQYSTANRSRYITAKGESMLFGARFAFYVWAVYFLLIATLGVLIGLYF